MSTGQLPVSICSTTTITQNVKIASPFFIFTSYPRAFLSPPLNFFTTASFSVHIVLLAGCIICAAFIYPAIVSIAILLYTISTAVHFPCTILQVLSFKCPVIGNAAINRIFIFFILRLVTVAFLLSRTILRAGCLIRAVVTYSIAIGINITIVIYLYFH